jgi:hypothetical protein
VPGRSAGAVCLLATGADRPADWVGAGQALQRILLTSAAWGVAAALHSQPFELGWEPGLMPSRPGLCPQLLLRLGTTVQATGGARRPLEAVLFTGDGEPAGASAGRRDDSPRPAGYAAR